MCDSRTRRAYYNPYRHPENALTRRDKILEDMLSMGFITEKACKEAKAEEITVNRQRVPLHNADDTTYAIDCAIRYLMRRDGFEFQYGFRSDEAYKSTMPITMRCTTRSAMRSTRAAITFIPRWIRTSRRSCRMH
ncbi:MAG: hypothetical protein ACLR8P_23245 [Clostridium fessum]